MLTLPEPAGKLTHRARERAGSPGLVLSPKTLRRRFAGPEAVGAAAAAIGQASNVVSATGRLADEFLAGLQEGPRAFVVVTPGSVQFTRTDLGRCQIREERALAKARRDADERASGLLLDGMLAALEAGGLVPAGRRPLPDPDPVRMIAAWSWKSRANMIRVLCSLDWTALVALGDLAMVTLTYPGEWLSVAPDSHACKLHVDAFKMRWLRRWGVPLVGVWKREFQERGAPHYHILCSPPGGLAGSKVFRAWLSRTWAEVVDHPDPVQRMKHEGAGTGLDWNEGLRMSDPKRIGVYFAKHGLLAGKEYQNEPPAEWLASGKSDFQPSTSFF